MQCRPDRIRKYSAFFFALMAYVCVGTVLLSGGFPAPPSGADGLIRPVAERVEPLEAPNRSAAPLVSFDSGVADDLHQEVVELTEGTDDDETGRHLLLEVGLGFSVPVLEGQTGLCETATDRGLTPFRLRAFSGRGSPRA